MLCRFSAGRQKASSAETSDNACLRSGPCQEPVPYPSFTIRSSVTAVVWGVVVVLTMSSLSLSLFRRKGAAEHLENLAADRVSTREGAKQESHAEHAGFAEHALPRGVAGPRNA